MSQASVLLIDDEPSVLQGLGEFLEDDGYDVHLATDGGEALGIFQEVHPELVVTDLRMPGMPGIEVIRRIKQLNRDTAVIVMTAYGSMESAVDAIRLKVFDFISKPIDLDQFKSALTRALDELRMTDRMQKQMGLMREQLILAQSELQECQRKMAEEESGPFGGLAPHGLLDNPSSPFGCIMSKEMLQKSEAQLRALSSQLLSAQEEERRRVARELHDSIGASLSAVKFSIENVINQMGKSMSGLPPLEPCIGVIQHAIEEVRRICMDLRPAVLDDLGIIATIDWFCGQFRKIHPEISIEKRIMIGENEIPDHLKIVIFRIVQEAFHNIAKHSGAEKAKLFIIKVHDTVQLTVKDNGKGFNFSSAHAERSSHKGLGVIGMRERTEISGGSFALESSAGEGTIVRASWVLC